jgi:3-isopropylmalate dehydrogenase
MSRTIALALIPGDGIGPEVVAEAVKVLAAVIPSDIELTTTHFPFGATHYLATGEILSDAGLDELKSHDAILLGAVGG